MSTWPVRVQYGCPSHVAIRLPSPPTWLVDGGSEGAGTHAASSMTTTVQGTTATLALWTARCGCRDGNGRAWVVQRPSAECRYRGPLLVAELFRPGSGDVLVSVK